METQRCQKCGDPADAHHKRHPFVGVGGTIADLAVAMIEQETRPSLDTLVVVDLVGDIATIWLDAHGILWLELVDERAELHLHRDFVDENSDEDIDLGAWFLYTNPAINAERREEFGSLAELFRVPREATSPAAPAVVVEGSGS